MRVGQSAHGKGLFACEELSPGQALGRMWGVIRGDEAGARALRSDRVVLLTLHGARCAVDVSGCVYEWMNHAEEGDDACNVAVSPAGVVTAARSIAAGEELRWDYGDREYRFV